MSDSHNNDTVIDIYNEQFDKFGLDAKSLYYHTAESQRVRFDVLNRRIDFENKSVLDIACGFGDFRLYLEEKGIHTPEYLGLEINENFVRGAQEKLAAVNNVSIRQFDLKDVETLKEPYDVTVIVGAFHHCGVSESEIYDLLFRTIDHLRTISKETAIMLTSNQAATAERNENYVYLDPSKILLMVLDKYPNKVLIDHSYFSKEFMLLVNS